MPTFSERLKELRLSKNIKQNEMANELQVSVRNYQRYEYGIIDIPLSKLIYIAEYFYVSLDYLVGRTDNPHINK